MPEITRLLSSWEFYALLVGGLVAWYGISLLVAHVIDGSSGDAAAASTTGVTVGMIAATLGAAVGAYFLFDSIVGAMAEAGGVLIVCAAVIAASSMGRK